MKMKELLKDLSSSLYDCINGCSELDIKEAIKQVEELINVNEKREEQLQDAWKTLSYDPNDELNSCPIIFVGKEDLAFRGFKVTTQSQIDAIADKMGNAYCDSNYWEDLDICADHILREER